MAIVAQCMSGNCKVTIHDDYFVKTKEEQDEILKRISQIYSRYFSEYPENWID